MGLGNNIDISPSKFGVAHRRAERSVQSARHAGGLGHGPNTGRVGFTIRKYPLAKKSPPDWEGSHKAGAEGAFCF